MNDERHASKNGRLKLNFSRRLKQFGGLTRTDSDPVILRQIYATAVRMTAYQRSLKSQWRDTSWTADPLAAVTLTFYLDLSSNKKIVT